MGSLFTVSVCLSDIPKESITTGKNGKKYVNLTLTKKKKPDDWGRTHTVEIGQSKEERLAKKEKVYCGAAREYVFEEQVKAYEMPKKQEQPVQKSLYEDDDDLPF